MQHNEPKLLAGFDLNDEDFVKSENPLQLSTPGDPGENTLNIDVPSTWNSSCFVPRPIATIPFPDSRLHQVATLFTPTGGTSFISPLTPDLSTTISTSLDNPEYIPKVSGFHKIADDTIHMQNHFSAYNIVDPTWKRMNPHPGRECPWCKMPLSNSTESCMNCGLHPTLGTSDNFQVLDTHRIHEHRAPTINDEALSASTFSALPTQLTPTPLVQESPPIVVSNTQRRRRRKTKSTKLCMIEGCDRGVRSRGLCKGHGGGRRCTYPGCGQGDQGGGFCFKHGGGRRCSMEGCTNGAQSRGICKRHGGGSRCKYPGCDRCSQGNGLCRAHGGGARCSVEGCEKTDRRGGLCSEHGKHRRCKFPDGCNRTARYRGLCGHHYQVTQVTTPAVHTSSAYPLPPSQLS